MSDPYLSAFIWSVADLLRGDYKESEYGKVILPFPMKPSGIEWLGGVPKHWEVKRLKRLSPFIAVGIVVNPSTFVAEEGLPFIYGGDIRGRRDRLGKRSSHHC